MRLGLILAGTLLAGASAAASPPSPPSPKPILVVVDGAGTAEMDLTRALLDGYYRDGGWGGSTIPAEAFAACVEPEGRVACVRETLRPLRESAGEVAVAVLVRPAEEGGVELTCIGGSRQGRWGDEAAQRPQFGPGDGADPAARERAETCVGRAYGEYMIP